MLNCHAAACTLSKGICSNPLVGVCMMVVVLDPPGLKGIYEGRKHQCAHNILYELVFAEGTVPTVMPNHKELQPDKTLSISST